MIASLLEHVRTRMSNDAEPGADATRLAGGSLVARARQDLSWQRTQIDLAQSVVVKHASVPCTVFDRGGERP